MKLLLLLAVFIGTAFGQNAVFTDYSPTIKGISIGTTKCLFFFKLFTSTLPYDTIVNCYDPDLVYAAGGMPNRTMQGSFPFTSGMFTWIISYVNGFITLSLATDNLHVERVI